MAPCERMAMSVMVTRLVTAVMVLLLAWPVALGAQPTGRVYRIGLLGSQSASTQLVRIDAFRQQLRDLGYEEGRTLVIHYRWAEGDYQRLPKLANELVSLNPDLIVAVGGVHPALAMKAATQTIPVVFLAGDPVAAGIVPSIARPGGNLTGFDVIGGDLNAKRLGLLRDALPGLTRVAVLWNPGVRAGASRPRSVELAANALKIRVRFHEARTPDAIDTAFAEARREGPQALLVLSDPMLDSHRSRIVDLAAETRLPAVYQWREFAENGGLMSYGTDLVEIHRRVATYVDKILKGTRPADLPVEQPTRFELVINMKTARVLGVKVPPALLLQADRLIE